MQTATQSADQAQRLVEQSGELGALSIRQFCKRYGIHTATFYRWQGEGNGTAPDVLEVGGRRLVPISAIRSWEQRHRKAA